MARRNPLETVEEHARDISLRDWAREIWRRKWLVLGFTIAVFAAALAYTHFKTPLYEASTQLMYSQSYDPSESFNSTSIDTNTLQVELNSVSSVIASPNVVRAAEAFARAGGPLPAYSVSAAPDVSSNQSQGSTVTLSVVSPNAAGAARIANAYAKAFTGYRKEMQVVAVKQAEQVLQDKMSQYAGINKQTGQYAQLQLQLQNLQIEEATVTGDFLILVPASTPSAPFTPRPVRNGIMGLAGGLILGIVAALLRGQLDTRARTSEEAAAELRMPLLGQIRKIAATDSQKQPLVVLGGASNATVEAVRKLRSNLEFANLDQGMKSFFITSCLQGEGKSFTLCNLALSLAATGDRIVLVDADLRRPTVHRYLNLPNSVGLSTVLTGKTELLEALRAHAVGPEPAQHETVSEVVGESRTNGGNRLHVLTSGPLPPNAGEMIASKSFRRLIKDLRTAYDMVMIDAPALLAVGDTGAIAQVVDGMIFLVDLARARRPLLAEAAVQLGQMPCRKLGFVVVAEARSRHYERRYYEYYEHGPEGSGIGTGASSKREQVRM